MEELLTLIPETSRSLSRRVLVSRELSVPPRMVATRSRAKLSGFERLGACQPMANYACCSGRSTVLQTIPLRGVTGGVGGGA